MTAFDETTSITALLSEFAADLIGLPGRPPLLSWQVSSTTSGAKQLGYELQAAADQGFESITASAAERSADSQFVRAPGPALASREVRYFRVRIETSAGWTGWSDPVRHEAGLLDSHDYVGLAIGDRSSADDPTALLRKPFHLDKQVARARLYATAHGVFELRLNGHRVGEEILAPGWSSYWHRLLVVAHDVTSLLTVGENVWGAELGDGWFRSKLGFVNTYNLYGDHTAFLGQLEIEFVDGTTRTIATDGSWRTSSGEVRLGSIYDGCTLDLQLAQSGWAAPGFDDSAWAEATVRVMDKSSLEPRTAAPVRIIRETAVTLSERDGIIRVDTHQNIAGWLRLEVTGESGARISVRHAEVVEPSGQLHTKALRGAKATDTYILDGSGTVLLEPRFTFHGFQFADIRVEGAAEVHAVTAVAISSDLADRAHLTTNHELLNKLTSNIYWSLRDNFVGLPTDCPQRDERMGWTGDAQVIAYAAHTMVDDYQFFKSWLRDVAIDQLPSGEVPVVVPDILAIRFPRGMFFSKPTVGWGDAATMIPWSLYERFGDVAILADQLESMRGWVRCLADLREGSLIPASAEQLGDWLDPDAPPSRPADAKVSGRFMANAYLAHSARLLSKAEALLGHDLASARSAALADETRDALYRELAAAAALTPTGAAVLLEFELAPETDRHDLSRSLAEGVVATDGQIRTGFLGTPLVLDAMSRFGHVDAAFTMLLRTKIRSWLYPVTVGATSMWERWEAIHEDGTIDGGAMDDPTEGSEGSMISFNHYAYGAVLDWIYRNVGGLRPTAPGYRAAAVAPRPHRQITSASAAITTGYGELACSWQIHGDTLQAELLVPFGVTAELDLPVSTDSLVCVNGGSFANRGLLTHGRYRIECSAACIAG